MSFFETTKIVFADSSAIDAYGRLRVSNPLTIFDSKLLGDNRPTLWDDVEKSGAGTASVYDVDASQVTLSVANLTAGVRTRRTFMRFNYQPGKSTFITMTGLLGPGDPGISTRIGYFDDVNGLFFSSIDGVANVVVRSSTSGAPVDTATPQANWNIDKFDGTGPSGVTLDFTKAQLFFIDFEWLSIGRIRFGFFIGGTLFYCHESLHANISTTAYMTTPNLPLGYEIENDGTGPASSMTQICSQVSSEGGTSDLGTLRYKSLGTATVNANSVGTIYALVGIRLKVAFVCETINLQKVTAIASTNDDFEWLLLLNPTVAGTFTYADETNSAVQIALGDTSGNPGTNTVTGGTLIDGAYVTHQSSGGGLILNSIHLGESIAGVQDEIVLAVRPLTANLDIAGGLQWRELS